MSFLVTSSEHNDLDPRSSDHTRFEIPVPVVLNAYECLNVIAAEVEIFKKFDVWFSIFLC